VGRLMLFVKLLFGVEDNQAKRAADDASSELRAEVQRVQDTVDQVVSRHDAVQGDVDLFDLLAHDMRDDNHRSAERGE